MTRADLTAVMIGGRRLLGRDNPQLADWSRMQWESWLRRQRAAVSDSGPRLLAVVAITCVDDLLLHVGLMQLLAVSGSRCRVVLSLAEEEAVRVVRALARREGWGSLVYIVTDGDCDDMLQGLPPSTLVGVFPYPALLRPDALARVTQHSSKTGQDDVVCAPGEPFVGLAANYGTWSAGRSAIIRDHAVEALRSILSQDSKQLRPASQSGIDPMYCAGGAGSLSGSGRADSGRLELPEFGYRDELVVIHGNERADEAVIARRHGDLCTGRKVAIRVPAALLASEPQPIRVELRCPEGASGTDFMFHVPPSQLKPWMISAFLNRGGGGNPVIHAFAEALGCRIAYAEDEPDVLREIPVVWGVLRDSDRILAQAKAQSLYFFYIDHAYFNRGHGRTYRITRNGYEAGAVRKCPPDRIASIEVELLPWRKGREIIVCPPTEFFMHAHNCADWLDSTLEKLRDVTDRPITVREKPRPGETAVPLAKALETAHALVTHSSNVAIEAACLGTPVFVSPASAAAPVGETDISKIESPVYPDREAWLNHLAYNQFSFEEIRDGLAWRMLLELEGRDLA